MQPRLSTASRGPVVGQHRHELCHQIEHLPDIQHTPRTPLANSGADSAVVAVSQAGLQSSGRYSDEVYIDMDKPPSHQTAHGFMFSEGHIIWPIELIQFSQAIAFAATNTTFPDVTSNAM